MRPLRVLMVCVRYLPELGGMETHVREVTRRLSALGGLDITVLATDRTRSLPQHEIIDGIKILRVPSWPRNRDYYLAPHLPAVVRQPDRWDLIHCQGIHSPVPVTAMLAAKRAAIPYVVTFHTGGHSQQLRNMLRSTQWRLVGPLLRDASALIAVSRFEAEKLTRRARLKGGSVMVIRNGGTLPSPENGAVPIPGRIVSSGRLERYKGHHRIIEVLPRIVRERPDAHLLILGAGPYESELVKIARKLDVPDRVTIQYIAPDNRRAMATRLAEASVVAALSDYEAHPVGVMEALSLRRPVVGYKTSGIAELVDEGWVHGVDPAASPASLASQLVLGMSLPPLADRVILPTWDACAEQLRQVYLALGDRHQDGISEFTVAASRSPVSSAADLL
jgi:glycosyltransferase involved in cell wall biosynthesis